MSREWEVGFVVPDGLRRAALIRLRLCALASLRFALPGVCPNTSTTRERVVRWIHLLALRARMFSWVAGLGRRDGEFRPSGNYNRSNRRCGWLLFG